MNRIFIFIRNLSIIVVTICFTICSAMAQSFTVTSSDIKPGMMLSSAQVYDAHGCTGENISPQLSWNHAPVETKSFAIICHDPDAPRKNGWYHWLVINIPSNINSIAAGGKIAEAIETITDFGQNAYGGACPPVNHGIHRYNFTVYALDTEKLEINPQSAPLDVESLVKSHAIAQATLTGVYERK